MQTRERAHCARSVFPFIKKEKKKRTMKAEVEQEKKERAEREPYLGMRGHEPLLKYPGFNALFYTPSPGGHQRSPTSPIRSKTE